MYKRQEQVFKILDPEKTEILFNSSSVSYTHLDVYKRQVLVQEHTVERPENGWGPEKKHLPHRLVCTNSSGESVSIIAIIKTQGSDTKLVAQMQPYYCLLYTSRCV